MATKASKQSKTRKVPITFECDVNGKKFRIAGDIEILEGKGFAAAHPRFARPKLPDDFQPELLSYVAITGYPQASLSMGKATNPFDDSTANFRTEREINLGEHGWLRTEYFSEARGTPKEKVTFKVTGDVKLRKRITSIAPVSEVWTPSKVPNVFHGHMTFTWHLQDGSTVTGFAKGRYEIKSSIQLTKEQMRVITFSLKPDEDGFKQSEVIRLYDLEEWATLLPDVVGGKLA